LSSELRDNIEQKIHELENEHKLNSGIILTETDLQCLLYKKLLEINILGTLKATHDGYKTYPVHTELSWYDENDKLKLKPDITILIPQYLKLTSRRNVNLSKKGCIFSEGGIIFELKFNRFKTATAFVKSIKNDIIKINELQRVHPKTFCYFIWFSKYNINNEEISSLVDNQNSKKYKIIYINGSINT
jgi:hypothetical protein